MEGRSGVRTVAKDDQTQADVSFTVEKLEAALSLLASEQQSGIEPRGLMLNVLFYLCVAVILLGLPLGLIIVWFDRTFGLALLAAAVAAFILLATPVGSLDLEGAIGKIKGGLEESGLGGVAKAGWQKRSGFFDVFAGLVVIAGGIVVLGGFIWLIKSLFSTHHPNPLSVVCIAAPILVICVLVAFNEYQEFKYFSQLSRLRRDLEALLKQSTDEGSNKISIASKDVSLLSQVETQQAAR
ncbi:MAG TPA: hypothetical protein VN743_11650, partial [Blastocatellia bacterium]|nr:hypothetical protein [Blastocatellia bacterium]